MDKRPVAKSKKPPGPTDSKSHTAPPPKNAKKPEQKEGVPTNAPTNQPKGTSPPKKDEPPPDSSTVPPSSSSAVNESSSKNPVVNNNNNAEENVDTANAGEVDHKIVLTKQSYLLLIFILVMILTVVGLYKMFEFKDEDGEPPTVYCNIAFWSTINAMIFLFIAALFGLVILSNRISNSLIGFIFMFLIVVCLMYPAKAIANSINSLNHDTDDTIFVGAKSPYNRTKLHKFWAVEQRRFNCCGTRDIDRIEDWSFWLNSSNLPASCCTLEHITALKKRYGASNLPDDDPLVKNITASCGYGLARTRTRGAHFRPWWIFKRVYSGFYLSLTKAETNLFKQKYKVIIDPESYLVGKWNIANQDVEMLSPTESFRYTWKAYYLDQLCNAMYYRDEVQYEGNPPRLGKGLPDKRGYYKCADRPEVAENDMIYPANWGIQKTAKTLGWIQGIKTVRQRCRTEGKGFTHDIIEKKRNEAETQQPKATTATTPSPSPSPTYPSSASRPTKCFDYSSCLSKYNGGPNYDCPNLDAMCNRTCKVSNKTYGKCDIEQKVSKEACCPDPDENRRRRRETVDAEGTEGTKTTTPNPNKADAIKSQTGEELCNITYPQTRQNATVLGRELLLVLDYLTSYIYEFGEKPTTSSKPKPANVGKGTWILWPIPTKFHPGEKHPFKLAANLNRIKNLHDEAEANKFAKKMFYVSRGIAENIILKDIIHEKTCESLAESDEAKKKYKEKLAQDVNRRFRLFGKDVAALNYNNRKGLGFWFLQGLHNTAWLCIAVSSGCVFLTLVIAVVFWQYFARIKAEEYANLALPKEFAVLNLRRGSMVDVDDIAMNRRRKQQYEHNLRYGQEGQQEQGNIKSHKKHE